MIHDLKQDTRFFADSISGIKNFEIRFNDRNFRAGDILLLRERFFITYTKRWATFPVKYVLSDTVWGMQEGFVIMALGPCISKGDDDEWLIDPFVSDAVKAL